MAVWLGPLTYAALGLGFKDKEKWSLLDHVLSATAAPVADVLTTPGRYISWDGFGFSWGAIITAAVRISRHLWLR
jgi:hypothetical protein